MIPFVREMDFAYGRSDQVSPLIRRVIADNPGPFTFHGTGTYIVGKGEVAVIDPGPADTAHFYALLEATRREKVRAILVTHDHADHAPLAAQLAKATGAEIIGCEPHPDRHPLTPGTEEDIDPSYRPGRTPKDGEIIAGPGWTLRTVATPGHTSNHLCFALEEENALFSGDHVMGWATTVVTPPDGNMTDYYLSLQKVAVAGYSTFWPTHGPPITEPGPFIDALVAHRKGREAQILAILKRGPAKIDVMVADMYAGLDPRLQRAAAASVLATLLHMLRNLQVVCDGRPGLESRFWLAR